MTAPARVPLSWSTYLGLARKGDGAGPAWESAATESTVAAGSPRSSQPKRTASSPSVTVMAAGALASSPGAPQGFAGGLAGAVRRLQAGFGARASRDARTAAVMSTAGVA